MRASFVCEWLIAAVIWGVQGWPVWADDREAGLAVQPEPAALLSAQAAPRTPVAASGGQSQVSDSTAKAPAQAPVGAEELLKMLQAGVSKDVIKAYIATADTVSHLSAADIVSLKEHGLPDDLTMALMKRWEELTATANQAGQAKRVPGMGGTTNLDALVAALKGSQRDGGNLNPEGYDYFRHYYLDPRAIASANREISSSYPPWAFAPYSWGWGYRSGSFAPGYRWR